MPAFILLPFANPSLAGPPFITEDSETPPLHGWEVNVPVIVERDSNGDQELQIPLLDINYGLFSNVQLKLEFAYLSIRPHDGPHSYGIGDAALGFKWRFLEEHSVGVQLAVYPQVVVPTGSSDDDFGNGKPSFILPLIAQKSFGRWTVFGNIGGVAESDEGASNHLFYGAALQTSVSDCLELAAEAFGGTAEELESSSSWGFNAGGILELNDSLGLLFSVGRAFGDGPSFMAYIGLQFVTQGKGYVSTDRAPPTANP